MRSTSCSRPARITTSVGLAWSVPAGARFGIKGSGGTELQMTALGDAISVTSTGGTSASRSIISVENVMVSKAAGVAVGGSGVSIIGAVSLPEANIRNVKCTAIGASPWQNCILGQNLVRSVIDGVWSEDQGAGTGDFAQGNGVTLTGTLGLYSTDNRISHVEVIGGFSAIYLHGHVEAPSSTR